MLPKNLLFSPLHLCLSMSDRNKEQTERRETVSMEVMVRLKLLGGRKA